MLVLSMIHAPMPCHAIYPLTFLPPFLPTSYPPPPLPPSTFPSHTSPPPLPAFPSPSPLRTRPDTPHRRGMPTPPQMLKQLRLTRIPSPTLCTLVLPSFSFSFYAACLGLDFGLLGCFFRALEGCGAEFFLWWGGGIVGGGGSCGRGFGGGGCVGRSRSGGGRDGFSG